MQVQSDLQEANEFMDLRGNNLIEQRERTDQLSDRSKQITNNAEQLK